MKAKAVFIDWGSLSWMRQPLGISTYNLWGLCQVVTKKIGTGEVYNKPIILITKEISKKIGKRLRTAGFEVIPFEKKDSDDQSINDRIRNIDPELIGEIVLVSADSDFQRRVCEKATQGVRVYWTATDLVAEGRRPMVSPVLHKVINDTDNLEFVELANFKTDLMEEPWKERTSFEHGIVPEITPQATQSIKITLSITTSREIADILREVVEVIAKLPAVNCTIEG